MYGSAPDITPVAYMQSQLVFLRHGGNFCGNEPFVDVSGSVQMTHAE